MTGPEHYREAERILDLISELPEPQPGSHRDADVIMAGAAALAARAQVHATLALAAATIEQAASRGPGDVPQVWIEAIS